MILVCDDNQVSVSVTRAWLNAAGFQCVVHAFDPDIAYTILNPNRTSIKLLMTDLNFVHPKDTILKDGIKLIEFIRNAEVDSSSENPVYIIAFSGDKELENMAIRAGANVFFLKPLKKQQIVDLVKAHC